MISVQGTTADDPSSSARRIEHARRRLALNWTLDALGALAAEADGFRLVVQIPEEMGRRVHFLVLYREAADGVHRLIGSGTEGHVFAAMQAARRIAERLLVAPFTNDA